MIEKSDKIKILNQFFLDVVRGIENDLDDSAYEAIDQDMLDKYGFYEICDLCNFDEVVDVIRLGFKTKYGEEPRF